jgi:AraC-like DNA-binding protein
MPSLPIPFFVTLLLTMLLHRAWRSTDDRWENAWFFLLLVACITHTVLVGLRWGYGVWQLESIQPVLGAALPPLAWLSFSSLRSRHRRGSHWAKLTHFAPVLVVAIVRWTDVASVDPLLFLIFLGYGSALLLLARQGPDALIRTRLEQVVPAFKAMVACAIALIVFAVVDGYVAVVVASGGYDLAASIVGVLALAAILMLGLSAAWAEGSQASAIALGPEPLDTIVPELPFADHAKTMRRVESLMTKDCLYRDPNLSLSRLARRAGIPARQVSAAINAERAANVSQYVNAFRVREACKKLHETDTTILAILMETGFHTKSNFNREFLRVTGMTPTAWRKARTDDTPLPISKIDGHENRTRITRQSGLAMKTGLQDQDVH